MDGDVLGGSHCVSSFIFILWSRVSSQTKMILSLCLIVPPPQMATTSTYHSQQTMAQRMTPVPASSAIFPTYDAPSMLLAKVFKPEDIKKPELTPEEEEVAKQEARFKFVLIVLASALPSLWAQDKLVWEKERAGKQVFGSKKERAGKQVFGSKEPKTTKKLEKRR